MMVVRSPDARAYSTPLTKSWPHNFDELYLSKHYSSCTSVCTLSMNQPCCVTARKTSQTSRSSKRQSNQVIRNWYSDTPNCGGETAGHNLRNWIPRYPHSDFPYVKSLTIDSQQNSSGCMRFFSRKVLYRLKTAITSSAPHFTIASSHRSRHGLGTYVSILKHW